MKFEIKVNELDESALVRLQTVEYLSTIVANYINEKKYGNDVEQYVLIPILIKTRPGYENWFKVRRPKCTEKRLVHEIRIDGKDFDYFISCAELEAHKFFAQILLQSIRDVALPKKIKDFDKIGFIDDVALALTERGLLFPG